MGLGFYIDVDISRKTNCRPSDDVGITVPPSSAFVVKILRPMVDLYHFYLK